MIQKAFTFQRSFASQISDFVQDVTATSGQDAIDTLRPVRAQLSLLHKSLAALTSAVSWANQYTAISWWITRRLTLLGLEQYTVVLAPGSIGDFQIATTSNASDELRRLADTGVLYDVATNIESLALIRVLHVPAEDGSSALWHPLSLGHELAHLKYDPEWVETWLSHQSPTSHGELATDAITLAQAKGSQVPSGWYQGLTYWLSEIACDTALSFQYGEEGLTSLETHLLIHSLPKDSTTHPSPEMRLAIQRSVDGNDLERFKPPVPSQSDASRRRSAALSFAWACKNEVVSDLKSRFGGADAASADCADNAYSALAKDCTPPSQLWPLDALADSPSSVESGLVRALWRRQAEVVSNEELGDTADMGAAVGRALKDLDRIQHAVDTLQFAARFETARRRASGTRTDPIANVVWVTQTGVKLSENATSGAATQDLRLGRHFIIFKRNEIASLNSLGEFPEVRAMQSSVEVGWGQPFVLHPGELVLAVTFETLRVDNDCCAQVLSRSSLGRMGLLSATAVQVQPGFRGCLTLELVNLASVPLNLAPGQRIAQVVPLPAMGSQPKYEGHYQDAGPRPKFSAGTSDWESDMLRNL
jgi:deoxycytidine triphosphate deaminase